MTNPTGKMRGLLLTMCLFGVAIGENSTVDDITVFTSTGLHPDSEALGQNVVWGEWSPWTKWSPCTRSCGGGISRQQRRCRRKPCKGKSYSVKYKVCNVMTCEQPSDFRAEQCAAFDGVPYSGQLFKWYPHHDLTRPCSLICRGVRTANDRSRTNNFRQTRKLQREGIDSVGALEERDDVSSDSENEDNFTQELESDGGIVVQLAEKVDDGTRCHQDTMDVCIAGACTKVGCDLRVGSNKNKDSCGVCGGNGSSCQPRYSWSLESISACSKSCGSGFKMAMPVCKSPDDSVSDDSNCDPDARPSKTLLPCNSHPCSTKWITGEWSRCSTSCGGGSRTRPIFCTEENGNETTKLPDHRCNAIHKPRNQETCNTVSCPMWESSQWSQCSVTCGNGVRTRSVQCRDAEGRPSSDCETAERPRDEQECKINTACVNYSGDITQRLMQPYPPPPVPEKLIDQKVPSESTFIPEEWSSCSVTCGEGIRHRQVHCKIFLEFSRTIATLPDKQCAGPKPPETEKCVEEACAPLDNSLTYRIDTVGDSGYEDSSLMDSYRSSSGTGLSGYESSVKVAPGSSVQTTYSWKEAGYTPCSATCLGGVQDLIINCVRDDDGKVVMPLLCTKETKPESRIRTCNDHPCPPRWNYSDFSPCKSPCGIGIQTRDVTCIHEVARGPGNTVVVPNQMCKTPPPVDRQHCNVWDCPPKWQVSAWSRCSKSCGGGTKRRKASCEQVMAQGHKQYRSDRDCPDNKPSIEKPCNTKSCHELNSGVQPTILSVNTTFIQRNIEQKVDLKIGATATVFPGTGVVKIRCPVKKFKRNQIEWRKDGNELQKSRKYKISRKGALRIIDVAYGDDGTYACIAGQSHAETRLNVNNRPREQMSSEEILRSGNTVHHRQNVNLHSAPANSGENLQIDRAAPGYQGSFTFGNDDLSHEARPDAPSSGKPTKKPRNRKNKPKPSVAPLDSSMENGEYTVTSLNQPGYQESVESTASSSASQLKPHLSQLISSLKAYWPFQGNSNGRGHRMAPPMFSEDSSKNSVRIHPEDETLENDLRYNARGEDFRVFGGDTVIPDDTFGPDEERIFIDDDPYDLDAAFFAIHNEQAPTIDKETKTINFPSLISTNNEEISSTTERNLDYIEASLINTKLQEKRIIDNYLRNQRGAGRSNNKDEKISREIIDHDENNKRSTIEDFNHEKQSDEKIRRIFESPTANFTEGENNVNSIMKTFTIEATTTASNDRTTPTVTGDLVKREGSYRSELSIDNVEVDESYDGELSREKITNVEKNETENGKPLEHPHNDETEAIGNETTREDISGGGEIMKEDEIVEDDETLRLAKDNRKVSLRDKVVDESSIGAATLAFENKVSSNGTTIAGSMNIYSHGTADNLTFEWITTDWSKCSQTCGGGGFQMRGAQCTVRPTHQLNNGTRVVARTVIGASLCEDAGFPVPQKVRACGAGRCPQWHAGDWTPCESSRCFNWKTAMQRRDISCRVTEDIEGGFQNVTTLEPNKCDDGIRPPQRQECYNDACKGVWRVGEWSECTASCEDDGIKYRILQCVWFGTKKPAGNACRDIPRPPVMKTCKGKACNHSTAEECKNHSSRCNKVKLLKMCSIPLYQKQCCETCLA